MRPLLVTLTITVIAWLILLICNAPHLLIVIAGAGWVQTAIMLGLTLRWKISGHCAGAAGFAMLVCILFGKAAIPLLICVPIIAWSRVRLGRHSLHESLAGALLGGVIFATAFYVAGNG